LQPLKLVREGNREATGDGRTRRGFRIRSGKTSRREARGGKPRKKKVGPGKRKKRGSGLNSAKRGKKKTNEKGGDLKRLTRASRENWSKENHLTSPGF